MRQNDLVTSLRSADAETIRGAASAHDFELARALFVEYAQWLTVDLCFQGFDRELASLPGAYAPPRGCLLLAGDPATAFACIALRPLDAAPACGREAAAKPDAALGEIKRLYVQPNRRGEGWGARLAREVIDEARRIGYRELKLDTLEWMRAARSLYASLGFRECAPYYDNPLAGAVYMSLTL
jgi:GNAT superfamily N-acetyltransferase